MVSYNNDHVNILLLSMSVYNSVLRENYYAAENGEEIFCGVSQLETGTKYFMRKLQKSGDKIDRIFIVESNAVRENFRDVSEWLTIVEKEKHYEITATEFYKRRIIQYIEGKEFCKGEYASEFKNEIQAYENRTDKLPISLKTLYPEPEGLFEVVEMVEDDMAVYNCVSQLCRKIKSYKEGERQVNLFLDMQGARRYETFIINAAVKTLEISDINVKGSVAIDFEPANTRNGKTNKIIDTSSNNIMFELVSGMNEFIRTGRGDTLRDFWQEYKNLPEINYKCGEGVIFALIREVSDAISLCDVKLFGEKLEELKNKIDNYDKNEDGDKQPLIQMIFSELKDSYFGAKYDLLPQSDEWMEEVGQYRSKKVINQIRWCIDKKLYQQALAIIEEKIPADMVSNNVFYYNNSGDLRNNEKEIEDFVNRMIDNKWDNPPSYLKNQNSVIPEKASLVWIRYTFANKKQEFSIKTKAEKIINVISQKSNRPKDMIKRKEVWNLLCQYLELVEQRNKVMHATGENYQISTMMDRLNKFVMAYDCALKTISYNYALERTLN